MSALLGANSCGLVKESSVKLQEGVPERPPERRPPPTLQNKYQCFIAIKMQNSDNLTATF